MGSFAGSFFLFLSPCCICPHCFPFFMMSSVVFSPLIFTLRFSPRHLISCLSPRPAIPGPLTPIDPKSRPRNPSAAAVLSLSLSTHFKLQGNIPFQHFLHLTSISGPWHVTTPRAPRCCCQICIARRGGTDKSVAL